VSWFERVMSSSCAGVGVVVFFGLVIVVVGVVDVVGVVVLFVAGVLGSGVGGVELL
jgi:hypothetical protein